MCKLFIGADPDLWTPSTRSLRIDGMVTSLRLENLFWETLEDLAARDGLRVPQLVTRLYLESLDEGHDMGNFTSFLRVCCLRFVDLQLADLVPTNPAVQIADLPADDILGLEKSRRQNRSRPAAKTH